MCLSISTATFSIHPDLVQPVEHTTSNTPSLICNILFIKMQCNEMVLHLSGVPVKISSPSPGVDFSEMWPINAPCNWKNRTQQLIEERFISLQVSVSKHCFTFFLWCCNQTHGFCDSLLRFPDHSQLDTDTLGRTDSILVLHLLWHSNVMDCSYVETIKHFQTYTKKLFCYALLISTNNYFWRKHLSTVLSNTLTEFHKSQLFLPGDRGKKWNCKVLFSF